jgi:hypothetical protein
VLYLYEVIKASRAQSTLEALFLLRTYKYELVCDFLQLSSDRS